MSLTQRDLIAWWTSKCNDLVAKGNVNCMYMVDILQAEELSTRGSPSDKSLVSTACDAYDKAIHSVTSTGHIHHEALANELAGSYCWSRQRSSGSHGIDVSASMRAKVYLSKSIDLYRQWGATAKVKDMRLQFGGMFDEAGFLSEA